MRAFLLIIVILAAGCMSDSSTSDTSEPRSMFPPIGEPVVQDHDHTNRSAHTDSSGLRLVSHVKPWGDGSEYGIGSINEHAINGNYVYVSRSNPEGGFAIIDLTDVRAPKVVGDFRSEGGADIEVTSDGNYVLLTTQRTLPGQQSTDNPTARTPRGVYVVDVTNKAQPRLSSFFPLPTNGPHTAHYHRAGPDLELVTLQTYDLVSAPAGVSLEGTLPTQRIYITELVRTGSDARLEVEGTFSLTVAPTTDGTLTFPHDSFIETHPVTGKRLMYVAYWDSGLRIVDITDLTRPVEVGSVTSFEPSALVQMHDARTFPAPIGGRHVTAVGPEIVTAPETGQVTFLNTTDPANPTALGHWSMPGNLTVDQPFIFSPHVFDTDKSGRLTIGHNHGGVWLIDASDPTMPKTLGFYFPHEERPGFTGVQPSVWGARFFGDYIVATDGPTGIYVLELEAPLQTDTAPGRVAAPFN